MRARTSRRDLAEVGRRGELRRWIFVSAFAHGIVAAALLWMPTTEPAALPGVITVDLVALAGPAVAKPAARAPAPARPVEANPVPPAPKALAPEPVPAPVQEAKPEPPKPAPLKPEAPKPEPPKPEPKPEPPKPPTPEAVIPKKPEREPEKPKAKPDPKPDPPTPAPKAVAKVAPPKPPTGPKPAPPKQESYDDLLAGLRAEHGESRPSRVERPVRTASAASAPAGGGGRAGAPASPEMAGWVRAVAVHLGRAWILPPEMRSRRLMTELLVDLDAQGNLRSEPRIVRGSGDARFDENAVRAIRKASPLPAPPDAGVWTIGFCPECRG